MSISVRWVGFDFGGTIQNPGKGYQSTAEAIREVYTEIGRPELINDKLSRFDELVAESEYDEHFMDGIADDIDFWKRHYRFRNLREMGVQKIFNYIFDNNQEAIKLFQNKGHRFWEPVNGLHECFEYLKDKEISINIVSEVGSEETIKSIANFLRIHNLTHYSDIITNFGRIKKNGDMDLSYKGLGKNDGAIYKKLARDLIDIGIQPFQALMIGDRPVEDVEKAKENGFKAIQFTGVQKRRVSSAADYVISNLKELENIL